MSSIRRKGIGLPVLVVLIASSLVFAPMGYYYNIAGVINKVYAQEEGGEEEVEVTTDDEEEEPTTITADEAVIDEQPPITTTIEEEVQQPLSASLFVDTTNGGSAPATFLFELNVEGGTEPYTFSWDFGDGSQQGSGESLTHTYENAGTYNVILTVTDSAGQTVTDTEQVTVVPPSPLTSVEIFANSTEGTAPATFEFAADIFREETRAFTFSWDFGDGSQQGSGEIVTHTFENPGTYNVILTVTNPTTGQTVTDTEQITVQPSTTTTEEEPIPVLPATEPTAAERKVINALTTGAENANITISPADIRVVADDIGFAPTREFVNNATEVEGGPVGVAYILNETSGESETPVVSMTTDDGDRYVTFADLNGTERSRFVWGEEACRVIDFRKPLSYYERISWELFCPTIVISASGLPVRISELEDGETFRDPDECEYAQWSNIQFQRCINWEIECPIDPESDCYREDP